MYSCSSSQVRATSSGFIAALFGLRLRRADYWKAAGAAVGGSRLALGAAVMSAADRYRRRLTDGGGKNGTQGRKGNPAAGAPSRNPQAQRQWARVPQRPPGRGTLGAPGRGAHGAVAGFIARRGLGRCVRQRLVGAGLLQEPLHEDAFRRVTGARLNPAEG